jgi:hypothetical protein
MIHFFSVHITPRWPKIQRKFLDLYVKNFKLYAAICNGVDVSHFDKAITLPPRHKTKIDVDHRNRLQSLFESFGDGVSEEDVICVIDSDAFPITPIFASRIHRLLKFADVVSPVWDLPDWLVLANPSSLDRKKHPWAMCMCFTGTFYRNNWTGNWTSFETNAQPWHPLFITEELSVGKVFGDLVYHVGGGSRVENDTAYEKLSACNDFQQLQAVFKQG